MRRRRRPVFLGLGAPDEFPDPRSADEHGLLAVGGDLSIERLLAAYSRGIFPWYDLGLPPLWWSPDPRTIMTPESLHVSTSMRRVLRRSAFTLSANTAFGAVIRACADREGGTWILPEMIDAYTLLHEAGYAHSIEVWSGASLVGGLYGVQIGALFAAESMFHRASNASKLVLIQTVRMLFSAGIELFDVQFPTAHLASLGAFPISRREYLFRAQNAARRPLHLALPA
ncbi:MAG: leucyl/phenylalanyl-tRNA--protein transferase [Polyangiaceae bacterium]